jgi:arabinogalactan oligomer/maltooligosaccharide transport system substrate-binding protein
MLAKHGNPSESPRSGLIALRHRRYLTVAALGLALSGCSQINAPLPVNLYLAIGVPDSRTITEESHRFFRQRVDLVVNEFQRIHPNINVRLAVYPEHALVDRIQKRNSAELGPDLILSDAYISRELFNKGLTDPIPDQVLLRRNIFANLLQRVVVKKNQLASQPFLIYVQLACFDRRQIPQAPTRIRELLSISASGKNIGLSLDAAQLFWTAGSLGALPALDRVSSGQPILEADRQAITNWLDWLNQAATQQRISFYPNTSQLTEGLKRGELSWITCSSSNIETLRKALGNNLGVSPLPSSEAHSASPFNRLRTLSLGKNSSPRQRKASLAFLRYLAQPQTQRDLTLRTLSFLPVNRHVKVPVASSAVLRAMVASRRQSEGSTTFLQHFDLSQNLRERVTLLLTPLVYGVESADQASEQLIDLLNEARQ